MMSDSRINRWLVLTSSVIINLCIGSAYAWSVFQKPLIDVFHWSTSDTSLVFTISFGIVPLAMIVAGKIQDKVGPKTVILVGGFLFGGGILGAGFTHSLAVLYTTYGITAGIGMGTVYACTVANTVKLFPDRRGLASGLVAAGFGSGAVLFAPLSTWLINSYGVLTAFTILGTGHLILIPVLSWFVKAAPPGYAPAGWLPPANPSRSAAAVDKDWTQMLRDPSFYLLWCVYTLGTISGLMIIAHASPYGQEIVKIAPQTAAMVVSALALANTGGRIFWGWVSDKVGRFSTVVVMFVLGGIAMLVLPAVSGLVPFVMVLIVVGLCFGGFMGIFPSITADAFGPKNLGMNYGVMFTAFGLAAFVGPRLAATVKELYDGDYTHAFLIAAAQSLVGIVLTLVLVFRGIACRHQYTPPGDSSSRP
jgi:OFA family oxalate/formate antiporter-like MFS transporter